MIENKKYFGDYYYIDIESKLLDSNKWGNPKICCTLVNADIESVSKCIAALQIVVVEAEKMQQEIDFEKLKKVSYDNG